MLKQRLKDLFEKYYSGTASAKETEELKGLIARSGDGELLGLIDKAWSGLEKPDPAQMGSREADLQAILHAGKPVEDEDPVPPRVVPFLRRRWLKYAASVLLLASAVAYFVVSKKPAEAPKAVVVNRPAVSNDIQPGTYKATLKLADGSTVELNPDKKGLLTRQGGTSVFLDGNDVSYQTDSKTTGLVFNTMSTPRGGQYRLKLSDGTLVWLNAASSITYPIEFASGERVVSVTGEVYFEVAANAQAPFKIRVNPTTEIHVLGTAFNVDCYPDEASIRTTLVEGAVRVMANGKQQLMQPGQQSQVFNNGHSLLVNGTDVQQVIAWKNGTFNFHRMKLDAVMRQLSRWYDVTIVYPEGVPDIEFGGKVQNTLSLQAMLEGLQAMGVHFRIDGRKVIVTNTKQT